MSEQKLQVFEMVGLPQEQISRIRKPQKPPSPDPPETPPPSCPGCGRSPHLGGRRHCPAYNLTCHHCQKLGHLAKVCRKRQLEPQPQARAISLRMPSIPTPSVKNVTVTEPATTIPRGVSRILRGGFPAN